MVLREVMLADVRAAVAFPLNEILSMLKEGKEKRIFANGTGSGKGVSSVHVICLRISNHSSLAQVICHSFASRIKNRLFIASTFFDIS
jgi:hypothetical protein